MLTLSESLVAAADKRPGDMQAALEHAAELAQHTGEGNAYWMGFGPVNVGLWRMLRPGSWTKPAGVSPVRVVAGEPGSRPRFVIVRWRAERGVESLFGGSKHVGRSATRCESCSLVKFTMGEPSRSCHGEGNIRWAVVPDMLSSGPSGVRGAARVHGFVTEQERPVCAASSAKTARISRW